MAFTEQSFAVGSKLTAAKMTALQGNLAALARGLMVGLTLSNGSDGDHDINIAAGLCGDAAGSWVLANTGTVTKQIDAAWATGTGAGGLFSGTVAANTWYHVFLIRKDSDGSMDAGFDASATAANIPAGYTAYRRIGSVFTDGAANIIPFSQKGDEFLWASEVSDWWTNNPGSSRVAEGLTVPTGIQVWAMVTAEVTDASPSGALYWIINSLDQNDQAPEAGITGTGLPGQIVSKTIRTNTLAQIGYRLSFSDADVHTTGTTHGWIDRRGKDD